MKKFQTRPILIAVLFLIISLACGGTATVPPTLDPKAIQIAIEQTLTAMGTRNTPATVPQPTSTAAPTETSTPVQTDTPLPTATKIDTPTSKPSSTPTTTTMLQTAVGASCIPDHPVQTGKVVDVVDGDTIKVQMDQDGQIYTVRYIGMDTPEVGSRSEYFGAEAAQKNTDLVYGKNAFLIKDVSETDRYDRLLRYVIVDGLFINYELVADGFANPASFPPDIACIPTFQGAEQKARAASLGLWNAPPAATPHPSLMPVTGGSSGGNAPCNCGGPDLDCGDFSTHNSAQSCYQYCSSQGFGDVFRLDGNHDGSACESLP